MILAGAVYSAWRFFPRDGRDPSSAPPAALEPTPGIPWFRDVTRESGIDFQHFDPRTPHHYIHETMGSGLGWIDYDDDGWLDLFCVQDGPVLPERHEGELPTNKLYRNLGGGRFEDATENAGLDRAGFHMGCAVGDYDNDGFDDLAVTYVGGVVLYRNESAAGGGRRFRDATAQAGLVNPHYGASCAWGDVDNDGLLDLYVSNYVEFTLETHPRCEHKSGNRFVVRQCAPTAFKAPPHKLWRNNGDGTFSDISAALEIPESKRAYGLGVLVGDLDLDGRVDIYVANDMCPAYLFHNRGSGKFLETAEFHGCAYTSEGATLAGMGVDAGDLDGSGRPSLVVTNFQDMPNILFRNLGALVFHDDSYVSGLAHSSYERLGFGVTIFDADNDGFQDIAVANGHVQRFAQELHMVPFAQRDQLYLAGPGGRLQDVSGKAGPYFRQSHVGRGIIRGDFDNDGLVDLAVSNNGGPAVLLRNETRSANNWVALDLEGDGEKSNRNAVGARVEVKANGRSRAFYVVGGGSYLSASSRRLQVGLGDWDKPVTALVTWPSGQRQVFDNLLGRNRWRLKEGSAAAERLAAVVPETRPSRDR